MRRADRMWAELVELEGELAELVAALGATAIVAERIASDPAGTTPETADALGFVVRAAKAKAGDLEACCQRLRAINRAHQGEVPWSA